MEKLTPESEQYWYNAINNTVVQVEAHVAEFDWLQPYRKEEQYEQNGSGFFVDAQGYIITNAHVVNQASTVWVYIPTLGRRPLFVDIISFCPDRDLALLRVNEAGRDVLRAHIGEIPVLPLGDSDEVQSTDVVLALGYPLGQYRMKSTTGIVSGWEYAGSHAFIQITAPVNPGNSGGPILNEEGHIIGIAIASELEAANIGYAIPINEMKLILQQMYSTRFIHRGSLGIICNASNNDHAKILDNPLPAGLYINHVVKNSLAERAGIRAGDMLYEFNGYRLDAFGDVLVPWSNDLVPFSELIARLSPGDRVTLVIYRRGKRYEIVFSFEIVMPEAIRSRYPGYEPIEYEQVAGLVVMDLCYEHISLLAEYNSSLLEYMKPDKRLESALIITHVLPGSSAHETRTLIPGAIIHSVNEQTVNSVASFREVLLARSMGPYLTIKTTNDIYTVLDYEQFLKDEQRLARDFSFTCTPTVQKLLAERAQQ